MDEWMKQFKREFELEIALKSAVNGFLFDKLHDYIRGVYIIYDASGVPLYIGESANVKDRLKSHVKKSPFKDEIEYFNIIPMDDGLIEDKEHRLRVESMFIDILNPKYNVRNRGESVFEEIITFEKMDVNDRSTYSNGYDW